ncbi:Argininosuccinate lyase [Cynara cardunculus var. scolymus]|uniref:Argininosuccinate lyase n=1 Tax=Cynara cardunculus var. scolymus TaxID=59895 RepID=A0A103YCV8_CYNCS|nr:Argininosuccinate lyase [Cynara cardunculus var. scolymus]
MDAASDRDFVLELLSANSITAMYLSRLGEEWVLWASEEFGFITPNDSVSTGSSIMPQKKNPDLWNLFVERMLEVSAEFAQNITYNGDRIQKALPAGHLDATTLADYLVHKAMFDDGVYGYLGVENSIKKFSSYGSTGSECVAAQLDFWISRLNLNL